MNAANIATFCAVRELTFVEAGVADGTKGAWFQTRKRERQFYTEIEVDQFAKKIQDDSARRRAISYTS
ncbi:MAG: hypothetical protein KF696_02235 [Planctomycetes bacterium]|nr:hypothetical protein [Planctomycetota bacterium]MCW8134820.1 hypothetical protein [Planctomycetota bacterium]